VVRLASDGPASTTQRRVRRLPSRPTAYDQDWPGADLLIYQHPKTSERASRIRDTRFIRIYFDI
jgi:hypothetical protein